MLTRERPGSAEILLLAWLIPFCLLYFSYYGFVSNYTVGVFHTQGFFQAYGDGVYRYRLLHKPVLGIWYVLVHVWPSLAFDPRRGLAFLDPAGDRLFYGALFWHNAVFLGLCLHSLMLLLSAGPLRKPAPERRALMLAAAGILCLSQFVVVPYDLMSYFFLLAGAWALLALPAGALQTGALLLAAALGMLTRESAVLLLAFHAVLLARPGGWSGGWRLWRLHALALGTVWLSLRLTLGWGRAVYNHPVWAHESGDFISWIFLLALALPLARREGGGRLLIYCAPYLALVAMAGIPFEFRLWIPVFLLLFLLPPVTKITLGREPRTA